eukprot:scaffold26981_cov157-Cylindrotheca_fusiformis.AAC.3
MSMGAQNPAQALQAAVSVGAAQQNQRNPLWGVQGFPPQMLGGLPPNFYPQMQAAVSAQETSHALVATAKLGITKKSKDANSDLVVRSSVRKLNSNGGVISVGSWARKVVEDNLDWLVKLARRNFPKENAILLAYGDGCETMVLFDDHINKMPSDFASIQKIGVGVSVADLDAKKTDVELAKTGVLQAGDPIWEHLKFHQIDKNASDKEKSLYIHTSMHVWSDGMDGRQRVIQVKTKAPGNPFTAISYAPNPAFEQQVLSKWKGVPIISPIAPIAPAMAPPPASVPVPRPPVSVDTLISFNPKELLLLEKAFDNALTPRDLKTDVSKFTADDKRKCQSVIRRAKDEIVIAKKRRKKVATSSKKDDAKSEDVKPPKSPEKPDKKSTPKKKTPSKSADDSDDEPISALKPKVGSSSSAKEKKPKKESSKSPKKTEDTVPKKRGRPKGSKNEQPAKKTRGKSKSKK